MKVQILKDHTRCSGDVYQAGDECTCTDIQGAKLIALGRAAEINTRGTRKTTNSDAPVGDDAGGADDNGD